MQNVYRFTKGELQLKILFLTNIPSPYRIDFFNELGKTQDVKVVFEAKYAPSINNNWYSDNNIKTFDSIFLKEGEIEEKKINWEILKHIKRKNQDVVVVTNYAYLTEMLALLWLKLLHIPYFLEVDGGFIRKESKLKCLVKTFLIAGAYGYISPSQQTDNYLNSYGAPINKIFRYPFTSLKNNDILDKVLSFAEKQKIREKLGMKEEKIILSVGQFIHRKGYDVLFEAMNYVDKGVGLYIVGGEPTTEYIELIERFKLANVHFIEFKSKEKLKEYYKAADLFVLPTREDIWGLVINEAMACGLPVITTTSCVAGVALIENGNNGYLVKPESANELGKRINNTIHDQALLDKLSSNSIKKIRCFTIEKMACQHLKIFTKNSMISD